MDTQELGEDQDNLKSALRGRLQDEEYYRRAYAEIGEAEGEVAPAPHGQHGELRYLVETYYDLQKLRIEASNRVDALVRGGGSADGLKVLSDWVDERLAKHEGEVKLLVQARIRTHPLWTEWLKGVKGVGPCIAGGLISWVGDIGRFDTVSKLWAYSGLHTVDGEAARRKKGEKANWSPNLKLVAWKAATSFVRVGKGYRELYLQSKEKYQRAHPEPIPYDPPRKNKEGGELLKYTPGHIDNMARRWVAKLFLAHVYEVWRKLEGLPVRDPYVLEQMGHTAKIPPPRE